MLILSVIGAKEQLERIGIKQLVDSPEVGRTELMGSLLDVTTLETPRAEKGLSLVSPYLTSLNTPKLCHPNG